MGLYDRHYIRDQPPARGTPGRGAWGGSMRMWSVTTWIILICVAVYVLDNIRLPGAGGGGGRSLLPMRDVPTGTSHMLIALPADMVEMGPPELRIVKIPYELPGGKTTTRQALVRPLVQKGTQTEVGVAEVYHMAFFESLLHFSTRVGFLGFEWWRFIGFQFLHANFSHLLFNMLGLYFFGSMVEHYLGSKRYLAFYLLCGMFGAFLYLILNLGGHIITLMLQEPVRIPGLLFNDPSTPLVGASAGIFGVLMAGAFIAPREIVYFFGLVPIRLNILAYALVAFALLAVITGAQNAGGQAGHLGGAIAGYYFIRHPFHLHGFFDVLGRIDPTSHHYRQRQARQRLAPRRDSRNDELDRILDKISVEGMHTLTESEKRTLRQASERG